MGELDEQLGEYLKTFEAESDGETLAARPKKWRRDKRDPDFEIRYLLYGMIGVDLTEVDGIGANSALQLISEIGTDLSE